MTRFVRAFPPRPAPGAFLFAATSGLGRPGVCSYGDGVSGFLRFVGMLNAAVWLGAAVFCSTTLLVALNSREAVGLIGAQYFTQVAGALTQVVFIRLYQLQIICAVFAWLHLVAEWMYLGRIPRRIWLGLLVLLFAASLLGSFWLCPKLTRLQRAQFASNLTAPQRDAVQRSFKVWDGVFQVVNVFMIGGIAVYFWRVTHAQDEPRFVSPSKFRS